MCAGARPSHIGLRGGGVPSCNVMQRRVRTAGEDGEDTVLWGGSTAKAEEVCQVGRGPSGQPQVRLGLGAKENAIETTALVVIRG